MLCGLPGGPAPETNRDCGEGCRNSGRADDDMAVEAEIRRNIQLAGQLGATGTPLFVIGDRVMNGAVGYDSLKQAIEDARSKKS